MEPYSSSSNLMVIISSNIQTYISAAQVSEDAELLELLVPICRSCLEHHHPYIRKNAAFAVYTVYHDLQVEHIRVFGTL
jgi:hypothetical protein